MRHQPIRRIALFSGNYNYVRDGANQALNRLVDYLERSNVRVRVYTPTTATPAFKGSGEIVGVPSCRLPFGRGEYRLGLGLSSKIRADLSAFKPDLVHLSCPDILGHSALSFAKTAGIPVVASMHTRFETYPRYYGQAWSDPLVMAIVRRFYGRCDRVLVPAESMAEQLVGQGIDRPIRIWGRGIDRSLFSPDARHPDVRAAFGFSPEDVVIGFTGRLVLEKGLGDFAAAINRLVEMGVPHRILVVGAGPARDWFSKRLPQAHFTGFLQGADLSRAIAAMDVFFNPSTTETFGNVTLEAMASAVPVVAANATGSRDLISHGVNGVLVEAGHAQGFADALAAYCQDRKLRLRHGRAAFDSSKLYDWDAINEGVLHNYIQALAFKRKAEQSSQAGNNHLIDGELRNRSPQSDGAYAKASG